MLRHLLPILFGTLAGSSSAITVYLEIYAQAFCGANTGELAASVTGGTPPYRYDWYRMDGSTPLVHCSDCDTIQSDLAPGLYRVTITDANLEEVSVSAEITPLDFLLVQQPDLYHFKPYEAGALPVMSIQNRTLEQGQLDDLNFYYYQGEQYPYILESPSLLYRSRTRSYEFVALQSGTTTGTITVRPTHPLASHCPAASFTFEVPPPTNMPEVVITEIAPSCPGSASGRVEMLFQQNNLPSSNVIINGEAWNGVVTPTANGNSFALPPGTHDLGLAFDSGSWEDWHIDLYPLDFSFYNEWGDPIWPLPPPSYTYGTWYSTQITVPQHPNCRTVSGTVFIDSNSNCTQQGNEPAVPSAKVQVVPGPYFATTNSAGNYTVQLPPGSYNVQEADELLVPTCNPGGVTVTISTANATVQLPCSATVAMDAGISLSSGAARPGFELQYGISVRNHTPLGSGAISVSVQLDPAIGFLGASPVPTTVNGQTITWNLAALPGYQSTNLTIRTQVPADIGLLGTDLSSTATVTTAVTDGNPANNTTTNVRTVTGSYDPNDKLATTSMGNGAEVGYDPAVDEWIEYTIRFQNTGTDTAFHVLIADTLPAGLDPASLRMGAASHPFTWELLGQGVLNFRLYHILLPDSNVNEPRSHGFVSFSLRPVAGALDAPGDRVDNIANIYFDFNPPVITEPCVVSIELSTAIPSQPVENPSTYPNPAQAALYVDLPTAEGYTAELVSMDGRVLRILGVIRSGTNIDVASLASGTYLLRLASPMHGVSQARFVKE